MGTLFNDDHVIVEGVHYHAPVWPPPPFIRIGGIDGEIFHCTNHSQLTDMARAQMSNVCRGAEYEHIDGIPPGPPKIWDVELIPLNAVTLEKFIQGERPQ